MTNTPWSRCSNGHRRAARGANAIRPAGLAATGIDWMEIGNDGFWRPNVHAQFLTDDGAAILMH
jgi:hypothetical protein